MVKPYPQMRQLLTRLKAAGFRLATATSKRQDFANHQLSEFGMLEQFDFLGTASEDESRKSKIEVLEYVIDALDLHQPEHVLMIGDRKQDFVGAHHFGFEAIAVAWGYGSPEELQLAEETVHNPQELEGKIYEWNNEFYS